jgi:hypothetical protein
LNRKQRRNILIFFLGVLTVVVLVNIYRGYFNTHYGSGRYYVNMFPFEDGAKNYRLVADVDMNEGDYFLTKVHFTNGGSITFEDDYATSPLNFDEKVEVEDDTGELWYAELDEKLPPSDSWLKQVIYSMLAFLLIILAIVLTFIKRSLGFFFSFVELDDGEKPESTFGKAIERIADKFVDWFTDLPEQLHNAVFWSCRLIGLSIWIYIFV